MRQSHITKRDHGSEAQRGFTLLEVTIAAAMLAGMAIMVSTLIVTGSDSVKYASRLVRATELTQEVMDDMSRELRSAVRIFEDNALGRSYRDALGTWAGVDPIGSSKLPTIEENEIFEKDSSSSQKTGNDLMFARHAWSDAFTCTSGNTHRISVYRIVRYFLKNEDGGAQDGLPSGLNFCKWVSEPLVDGIQIDAIDLAADRKEVLKHLRMQTPDKSGVRHDVVQVAWHVGEDLGIAETLRHIQPDGNLQNNPKLPRTTPWRILRQGSLSVAGMLGYRRHSVVTNYARSNAGASRYGIRDDSGHGFPHGFEVQVVGVSAGRKVLLHLSLVSTNNDGQRAYFQLQTIVDVREG